ncbi:hypothetical protein HFP15_13635 [Amycolatopsis sp. K13G38]|uniref:Uncharacterized protein n=1 Tax=Amycolatopsis acididurans TaxID=2724524 RepID=A0ABX1J2E0_9PSEU|nr:hypothetical protein [Amycolatopsis acididurans]NKQ53923.1 hypothetical protein [Amycolatopsis acididurans]
MTKVTAADLEVLLASTDGTKIVLEGGRLTVVPPESRPAHDGALTVATREELRRRIGEAQADQRMLEEQAEILNTEISTLGA